MYAPGVVFTDNIVVHVLLGIDSIHPFTQVILTSELQVVQWHSWPASILPFLRMASLSFLENFVTNMKLTPNAYSNDVDHDQREEEFQTIEYIVKPRYHCSGKR